MYALKPDQVYAHQALRDDADARVRLDRFLGAMGRSDDDVAWYCPEGAVEVAAQLARWQPDPEVADASWRQPVVFTRYLADGTPDDDPVLQARPSDVPLFKLPRLLGYQAPAAAHHLPEMDAASGMTCWPAMFLSAVDGCSHGCVYCGAGRGGKALIVPLNVHEFLDRGVRPVLDANPWQKAFLMMGQADIATLEPEYGLFEDFLGLLAEYEDRYGYCHTNGDNVDWMADLTHRERIIAVWSLCSDEAAAIVEPGAPPARHRIDAMARLCDLGVPVRVKLKPVVPIRGWRDSHARLLEDLLTRTRPETLGFASLIWMDDERLRSLFDPAQLDPEFVEAAHAAREEMRDSRHGPFPHAQRETLYRHLIAEARRHRSDLPLFVCTETTRMWEALQDVIGQHPRRFLCGCNSIQGPGPRHLPSTLVHSNYENNLAAGAPV